MRWLFAPLLILLALLAPVAALAHAQLRGTDPAEGAIVAQAPDMLTLRFSEPVAPLVLRWIAPDGTVTGVEATARGTTVTAPVPQGLGAGTHLVSWRVVSADGHPVGGTLTFHIGEPSGVPAATAAQPAAGAARAAAVARFGLTVALVGAVGAAVFAALVGSVVAPARRVAMLCAVMAVPFGAVLIGVQGLDLLALGPDALRTAAPWQAGLGAPVALTVALSVAAVAMAAVALRAGPAPGRVVVALVAWGLAAGSFAVSGHAAIAPPRSLALPAVVVHAAALIFWMGALVPLVLGLRHGAADAVLRRFSNIATPMVALLVLSGGVLVWLQSGGLAALAGSAYGGVLAAKLVLVAGLVALAARNRLVLTPALADGDPAAPQRLRSAIRAEILLGLAVLALASGFRLTPPPRALVAPAEPLYAHIHTARAMADIVVTPGRAGPVTLELGLQTADLDPLVPRAVEITLAMPAQGIEPIRLDARPGADAMWHAGPVTLAVSGDWVLTLRLLISDFESLALTGTLTLPP